jgi:hypothetical protein
MTHGFFIQTLSPSPANFARKKPHLTVSLLDLKLKHIDLMRSFKCIRRSWSFSFHKIGRWRWEPPDTFSYVLPCFIKSILFNLDKKRRDWRFFHKIGWWRWEGLNKKIMS